MNHVCREFHSLVCAMFNQTWKHNKIWWWWGKDRCLTSWYQSLVDFHMNDDDALARARRTNFSFFLLSLDRETSREKGAKRVEMNEAETLMEWIRKLSSLSNDFFAFQSSSFRHIYSIQYNNNHTKLMRERLWAADNRAQSIFFCKRSSPITGMCKLLY